MKIPEVRFILKNPKSEEETLIYMVARYHKQRLVYSTGVKILPDLWDAKERAVTEDKVLLKRYADKEDKLAVVRLVLSQHKAELDEMLRTCKVKKQFPHPNEIKLQLDEKFNKKSQATTKMNLFQWIDQFIKSSNNRPVTIKGYNTTLNHLKEFQKQNRRRIDFDTVDLDFYDAFTKYFQDQSYTINTIGKNVKNVKVFMSEATERGYNTNMTFRNKRFRVPEEATDQIYLTEKEIMDLYNLDLSDKKRLDKVRDIFVAACYTGLRFSDLNEIKRENLIRSGKGKLLKVKTNKTGEVVVIPLHKVVERILNKHEGGLPRIPSNQKLNSSLKDLGFEAQITEKMPMTGTKGKFRTSVSVSKYQMITVHTARRSFATNAFLAGVPVISIMKITGHRTERSFMKYIRITKEDNARKLLEHPFFQPKSNLKIV